MKHIIQLSILLLSIATALAADTQSLVKTLAAVLDKSDIPAVATAFVLRSPKESRLTTLDDMLKQVAKYYQEHLPSFVWRVAKADLQLVPGIVAKVNELRASGVIVSYSSFSEGGTPVPPEPPVLGTIGYTMRGDAVVVPVSEAVGVIGFDEARVKSRR